MLIKRHFKLEREEYYVAVDLEYENESYFLKFKNYEKKYFDSGNLRILLEKIDKKYNYKKVSEKYFEKISLIADILYIYDNFPLLSGVGTIDYSTEDGQIIRDTFMSKEEIDKFIQENNIKMMDSSKFNLIDERTWDVNKEKRD